MITLILIVLWIALVALILRFFYRLKGKDEQIRRMTADYFGGRHGLRN